MSAAILHVLGRTVTATMTVAEFGELLGYSRSQAFRVADTWPMVGSRGSRRVVVPAALEALGIPYQVETDTAGDRA